MSTLTESKIVNIVYTSKSNHQVYERIIIPTFVSSQNVKALDVLYLSQDE